jgi:2-oxoglutarate dehydrogenase E2 component (dihydrolipoamide succinyltransferase)
MSVTLDQLSVDVQSFFIRKLHGAVGDAPGNVLLVLDGFGSPLPPSDFGVGATASQLQLFAHQRAAQLADQLPAKNGLSNGWYLPRSGSRLSVWYKAAVAGSVCTSDTEKAVAAFEARKAEALKRIEANELLEVGATTNAGGTVNPTGVSSSNLATGMTPTGWFLPDADSWEEFSIDGTEKIPPAPSPVPTPAFTARVNVPAPAPPNPDLRPIGILFNCFVGDIVNAGDHIADVTFMSAHPGGDPDSMPVFAPASGTVLEMATPGVGPDPGDQVVAIGVRAANDDESAERSTVLMPRIEVAGAVGEVRAWHKEQGNEVAEGEALVDIHFEVPITDDQFELTVPAPVSGTVITIAREVGQHVLADSPLAVVGTPHTPEGYTVSFEYTIVSFTRPWWDDVFLAAKDWMVPGFARGGIATGSVLHSEDSPVTLITSGVVVVRNLTITSHWKDDERDQLASGALNLGPFTLSGAKVEGETLTRRGVQAMAWVCQVPPVLPPIGDSVSSPP